MRVWQGITMAAFVAIVGACASFSPPILSPAVQTVMRAATVPTAPSIQIALPLSPAIRTVDPSGGACAGVGIAGGTLRGDAHDPRVAWLDIQDVGTKGVLFPTGYTARFTPSLEVLDASGLVKFRAGDAITEGCVWGQDLLIGWP